MVDQPNNEGQNGFISTFNIDGAKFVIPDTIFAKPSGWVPVGAIKGESDHLTLQKPSINEPQHPQ